jgi:hypothetical protein
MNSEGHEPQLSDITLEQYLLGELPRKEMAATKRLLERDEKLRNRLEELERSNLEILEQYPAERMSRRIQSKLDPQPPTTNIFQSWPMKAFVGAAALVLLVLLLPHDFDSVRPGETTSTERLKGQEPHLKLFRKTPDGSEGLEDGARVVAGDIIRIAYLAAGHPYGLIVSVDGKGAVTLHVPHQGSRSVRLENDGEVLLDFALELDDAPRWERFFFVTCDTPFDVAPVLEAARQIKIDRPVDQAEKLDLPDDLDQFVISLEKGAKP